DAFGAVTLIFPRVVSSAVELIGLANLVAAAALGDRLALLDDPLAVFRFERIRSPAGGKRHRHEHPHARSPHPAPKTWAPGPPHRPLATRDSPLRQHIAPRSRLEWGRPGSVMAIGKCEVALTCA